MKCLKNSDATSKTQTFEWCSCFIDGQTLVEDLEHCKVGQVNAEKVHSVLHGDRWNTINDGCNIVGLSHNRCWHISDGIWTCGRLLQNLCHTYWMTTKNKTDFLRATTGQEWQKLSFWSHNRKWKLTAVYLSKIQRCHGNSSWIISNAGQHHETGFPEMLLEERCWTRCVNYEVTILNCN